MPQSQRLCRLPVNSSFLSANLSLGESSEHYDEDTT